MSVIIDSFLVSRGYQHPGAAGGHGQRHGQRSQGGRGQQLTLCNKETSAPRRNRRSVVKTNCHIFKIYKKIRRLTQF